MKHVSIIFILSLLFNAKAHSQFAYLNPLPNSSFHHPQTTLAIRNDDLIDESSLHKKEFLLITGSKSGRHSYTARLSDDGKTVVVHPNQIFEYGEKVSVTIYSNRLKKKSGNFIDGTSYSFNIRDQITPEQAERFKQANHEFYMEGFGYDPQQQHDLRDENLDSLPTYTIGVNNNASPGQIFFGNENVFLISDTNCFTAIIENDGSVTWGRNVGTVGLDFKINYNGYLTYFNENGKLWMVLDSSYNLIDSIQCGNGYGYDTNPHDIAMYPDGHTLLLVADKRTVDLTQYGGQVDATVTGVKIQELDAAKDVIWEWDGWDHFDITDAVSSVLLTTSTVDYVHTNALSRDDDGNIIISNRHLNEITKINRTTGDFIWRLNGENNQFTFVNDNIPDHFSYQHDAHRIANGNLMLYNNGKFLSPAKGSSKEYNIDEVNMVATLVWYYEHPDVNGSPVFGPAMGSSQRLPNGNTLIDWGTVNIEPERPDFTEVDYNKNIVWEMNFDVYGQCSYRVHKYLWNPCEMPKPDQIGVKKITDTSAKVIWAVVNNASSYDLRYRRLGNADWKLKSTAKTNKKISNLKAGKSYEYQLRTHCSNGYVSHWTPLNTFTTLPQKLLNETPVWSMNLYPNPADETLNLNFDIVEPQNVTMTIYNMAGKSMLASTQSLLAGEQSINLDVSSLPSSLYFVELKLGEEIVTMKFVKE